MAAVMMQDARPADDVVCATINEDADRWGSSEQRYAYASELAFLYDGNVQRACAELRKLKAGGLLDSVKLARNTGWILTPAGVELAQTALRACRGCSSPVEPGLHDHFTWVCRECLIGQLEERADESEEMSRWCQGGVIHYESKAQELRAQSEALRRPGA